MNPVTVVLGLAVTALGSVGVWTFLTALLTRKSDNKSKDTSSAADLETASQSYRHEVRAELDAYKRKFGGLAGLVVNLLRTYDTLMPKVAPCLDPAEIALVRAQTDAVWKAAVGSSESDEA